MIGRLLSGSKLWSFAIYAVDGAFIPGIPLRSPVKLFNSKRIRLFRNHPYAQADPFLLVEGDTLYIFHERMRPGEVGKLACFATTDLETYDDLGVILDEPHHLSWPFVFEDGGETFLVPESEGSGEVTLYRFEKFPAGLLRVRTLLRGLYADPVLLRHDGLWYLFGTTDRGLELFTAAELRSGAFLPHPLSSIVTDKRYSRSGGPPIRLTGSLFRVSQDCSGEYGKNASLIEIERLSPDEYRERVVVAELFDHRDSWNRDGAHHLSVASFRGQTVIAADGRHRDYVVNKLFKPLRLLARAIKSLAPRPRATPGT